MEGRGGVKEKGGGCIFRKRGREGGRGEGSPPGKEAGDEI